MPRSSAEWLPSPTTPARSPHRRRPPSSRQQAAEQQPPPQAAPVAAAPAAGGADMVAQLESLKKLLDEGVLTQAEFDTQKQKLLASS